MRFFVDTEFTHEDTAQLQLISIAIVAEDGSEYYAVSNEWEESSCSDWVREHVLPFLEPREDPVWRTRAQIRDELTAFIGDRATELWGYVPAYDQVLVHGLFGGWSNLPESWPWNCWDLKQWAWQTGAELPAKEGREHHALDDARHAMKIFDFVSRIARDRRWPDPTP